MSHNNLVTFDTNIIPDPEKRHKKEALELFRRGSNINDAVHLLELEIGHTIKDPIKQVAVKIAIEILKERVDSLIEDGIDRYLGRKNVNKIVEPGSYQYIEPDRKS